MIGHRIPESFNESHLDELAHEEQYALRACPAFTIEFQCVKNFPRCVNTSDATYVLGMCTESCLQAKRYQGGFCAAIDIDAICADKEFFDPPPDCVPFAVDTNQPDEAWKLFLGAVLGSFGLIALCSIIIGYARAKLYKPDKDAHDFEDERREAERINKLKEKAAKHGEEYTDLDVQAIAAPSTRRWTSAQEAREVAATRQRQATLGSEQELTEFGTDGPREIDNG